MRFEKGVKKLIEQISKAISELKFNLFVTTSLLSFVRPKPQTTASVVYSNDRNEGGEADEDHQ